MNNDNASLFFCEISLDQITLCFLVKYLSFEYFRLSKSEGCVFLCARSGLDRKRQSTTACSCFRTQCNLHIFVSELHISLEDEEYSYLFPVVDRL